MDPNNKHVVQREAILKQYSEKDIKSYIKEINVFNALTKAKLDESSDSAQEKFVGFPECIEFIETKQSAEILMEVLGHDIRKMLKKSKKNVFSKATVFKITIQLVSNILLFLITLLI